MSHGKNPNVPNNDYEMISCDSYTVQYPSNKPIGGTESLDDFPTIGVWIQDGEHKRYEGYPVSNVAYIINANGKTIDTIRAYN